MPPTDLGQLLDRAARGDADAFADFYDLTISDAYRLAQASLNDQRRTESLVHDVYVRAWRELRGFPTSGRSPQAWLMCLVQDATRTTPSLDARARRRGRHRRLAVQATPL